MSIPTRTAGRVDRADFGGDTTDRSLASAITDYRARHQRTERRNGRRFSIRRGIRA